MHVKNKPGHFFQLILFKCNDFTSRRKKVRSTYSLKMLALYCCSLFLCCIPGKKDSRTRVVFVRPRINEFN